jgi:hypothetical protein
VLAHTQPRGIKATLKTTLLYILFYKDNMGQMPIFLLIPFSTKKKNLKNK